LGPRLVALRYTLQRTIVPRGPEALQGIQAIGKVASGAAGAVGEMSGHATGHAYARPEHHEKPEPYNQEKEEDGCCGSCCDCCDCCRCC